MQVAPLDLSGVDLSQPSGQTLQPDKRWTGTLIFKLALPLALAIVSSSTGILKTNLNIP